MKISHLPLQSLHTSSKSSQKTLIDLYSVHINPPSPNLSNAQRGVFFSGRSSLIDVHFYILIIWFRVLQRIACCILSLQHIYLIIKGFLLVPPNERSHLAISNSMIQIAKLRLSSQIVTAGLLFIRLC